MKPADLNRAVARATGESVSRIRRLGFGLVVVPRPHTKTRGQQTIPMRSVTRSVSR